MSGSEPRGVESDAESTISLLERARGGDTAALNKLFARAMPPLKRWARGRLPRWARDIVDTDDLVQETVIGTLRRIDAFEVRTDGALTAYLRQAVMNRVRNEIRHARRHPAAQPLESGVEADGESPLEALIGRQNLEAYDRALVALDEREREAVIGRVELGLSYRELAEAQGRPTAEAARMAVARALVKLAKHLDVPARGA